MTADMDIAAYLDEVRAQYQSGHATEHSYRPALFRLFQGIDPALTVVNEPKKSEAGMPDFLFERDGVPLGWAEAKDVDKDVIKLKGYSIEQRKRYEKAYPNLIYTNGVDFEFIREGVSVHFVSIADFLMGLQPNPDRFEELERHGYLDNPTFRGMRWHLLETFDKIYVLNLHGNYKRKEKSPDGSPDINVFDIQQGVALIIAVKTTEKSTDLAQVFHADLWGKRQSKNETLFEADCGSIEWCKLNHHPRYFMFYPVNHDLLDKFDAGFALDDLFLKNEKGITTSRDDLAVAFDSTQLADRMSDFTNLSIADEVIRKMFWGAKKEKDGKLPGDTASWSLHEARRALTIDCHDLFKKIAYRPFDFRELIYSNVILERPRADLMLHVIDRDNICLSINRGIEEDRPFSDALVFDRAIQLHSLSIKEANNLAPLYAYPDESVAQSDALAPSNRFPNLNPKLYAAICKVAGINPADQAKPDADFRAATGDTRPSEIKLFDYIYGVLHSPDYRTTYAEFLKIDFPRIPYPPSPQVFAHVSEKGEQLRRLHLMEVPTIGETLYPYYGEGDDMVAKGYPKFAGGKVQINKDQHFADVPAVAWTFHIGGYQPAQKWLKDRLGRVLSWDDIGHYQKIVKILTETDRIMKEIKLPL